MTIGTGIFLSSLMLSLVALFVTTKDRWDWKKISIWIGVSAFGVPALLGTTWFAYTEYKQRLQPQTEFWGVPLGATEGEVKLLKGTPMLINDHGTWLYDSEGEGQGQEGPYGIRFKDGKVWWIAYLREKTAYSPGLVGVDSNANYKKIVQLLGEPSYISISEDETSRALSYKKLNVFFKLTKDQIETLGIFDPEVGPFRLNKERKSPNL